MVVSKQMYEDGINCRGMCFICKDRAGCYQFLVNSDVNSLDLIVTEPICPTVEKAYQLSDKVIVGVDQASNMDRTVLCFARFKNGSFVVERFQDIEKQEDMDNYVNRNKDKWLYEMK